MTKNLLSLLVLSLLATAAFASGAKKAETSKSSFEQGVDNIVSETKEMSSDAVRAAKKAGREIEDKACEMVNGKLDCAAQKIEHSAKNAADKAEDVID